MKHEEMKNRDKKAIRHHLCQLILVKKYDDITVKEICDAANVSRMTFYRLYNNKDDVLTEYTDERFADFYSIVKNIPNLSLENLLLEALKYVGNYKTQIGYLIRAHREFILLEQFNSYAKYLSAKFSANADFANEAKIYFLTGGFLNIIMKWLIDEPFKNPEEIHNKLMDIMKNAF